MGNLNFTLNIHMTVIHTHTHAHAINNNFGFRFSSIYIYPSLMKYSDPIYTRTEALSHGYYSRWS